MKEATWENKQEIRAKFANLNLKNKILAKERGNVTARR